MLRALSPVKAWLLIAAVVIGCLIASRLSPGVPETSTGQPQYTDMQLYHDVAAQVAGGADYYKTATRLQREHNFPVRPFVTVRLPTLAHLAAWLGWDTLRPILLGLLLANVVVWYRLAPSDAGAGERVGMAVAVIIGGAMVSQPLLAAQHELWAGLLIGIALPLRSTRFWPTAVLAAAAALAIREMALPFVLLAMALSWWEGHRREALAYALLVALFGIGLEVHAVRVLEVTVPTDPASQGWNAMRGPLTVLVDLVDVSVLNRLPAPFAYPLALLALLGWAALPKPLARAGLMWFVGYAAVLAMIARAQNFYWAIVLLPAWFVGFAFLPRALRDLAQAALAGRRAAL